MTMKRYFLAMTTVCVALLFSLGAKAGLRAAQPQGGVSTTSAAVTTQKALIDQYCVTCHNQRTKTAGLALDTLDITKLPQNAEVWEKAIMKLRGHLMPHPNARQPDAAATQSLITWLETSLDQAAVANPNPGNIQLHRLNRAEYAAS